MINILKQKIHNLVTHEEKFNKLRELCQLLILKVLDEQSGFQNLAFVGGTALRILYDLNRFSEDLDFCLIESSNYDFLKLMKILERELKLYNLDVSIRAKDHKTVSSAFIKFDSLLHELQLTPHKEKKLMIKFEVDQNPPLGFKSELSIITKEFMLAINHYDLPSLFSGKLHALLCRKYTKGRDFYDLIWYLGKKITPNFVLLNNAIFQTEHKKLSITKNNLNAFLREIIKKTDFKKVLRDVEPFLSDPKESRFFNEIFFLKLLD